MMSNRITRSEKIRLLNGLKNGSVTIDEVTAAGCEVWKKNNGMYDLTHLPGDDEKKPRSLSSTEMEPRLKAKSKTVIKTHHQETIVIF
jgi:hypothetical protein